MRFRRNASTGSLGSTDRPILLKGRCANDRWLVGSGALVDIVGIPVGYDRAFLRRAGRGVVGAEVLDDVVLDEGRLCPSVDGEIAVAVGLIGAGVLDHTTLLSV